MKEKIMKGMVTFFIAMFFCTIIARAAASLTVAKVKTEPPRRGTLVLRFQGTGTIRYRDREFQSLPEGQKVARVLAKPGRDVKKGEKILQLDMDYLEEQIKQQEREIQMKEIVLKQQELEGKPEKRVSAAAQAKLELEAAKETLSEVRKRKPKKENAGNASGDDINKEDALTEENEGDNAESGSAGEDSWKEELESAKKACEQAKDAYRLARQEEENQKKNEGTRSQISKLGQESTKLELEGMKEKLDKLKKIKKAKGLIKAAESGRLASVGAQEGTITTGTEQIVLECGLLEACGILPPEEGGKAIEGDEISVRFQGAARETTLSIETVSREGVSADGGTQEDSGEAGGISSAGSQVFWHSSVEEDSGEAGASFTYEYSKNSDSRYDSVIPLSSLREAGGTAYVLIAEVRGGILGEDYEAVKIPVTVLGKDQENAAVEGSFPGEALVITESNKYVKEGDRVRLDE
ncbi:MAG: hypothetical protein HFG99_08825 [Dorea sp.]|jgi:multidrug efflux pump subunit AcrA (membrane-fusion protein)|nr:hypothetical protein [Dorea sp.]